MIFCTSNLMVPPFGDNQAIEDQLGILFPTQVEGVLGPSASLQQKAGGKTAAGVTQLTVQDYLDILTPRVPAGLVSPSARSGIRGLAARFPAALTHGMIWEARLAGDSAAVDFSVSLRGRERAVLAGLRPALDLPQEFFQHSLWQRIRRFAARWADERSTLFTAVDSMWLEFDMQTLFAPLPLPSVFFGSDGLDAVTLRKAGSLEWVSREALPLLLGEELPAGMVQSLEHLARKLPVGASIFQIGLMLSRGPGPLRVCLRDLPSQSIIPLLAELDYPGPLDRVRELVTALLEHVDALNVDLDLDTHLGEKLGLEATFNRRSFSNIESRYARLMEWLIASGWCTPEKQAAFERFPGYLDEVRDRSRWPETLLLASKLLGPRYRSVMRTNLSHIKLQVAAGNPVEAKIYMVATHSWLDPLEAVKSELAFRPRPLRRKAVGIDV